LCFAFVASQINLQSPQSRSGNGNIRVVGSTAGVNPCGNGTDTELRASQNPVGVYWNGGNATNISIAFGNLNAYWTMSIVSYINYTGVINPNATLPLPIFSGNVVVLRGQEKVSVTTNGTLGTYVLKNFYWPVEAAAACRPNYYGCALRVQTINLPSANDSYFSCSDIRVYSHAFDQRLVFTVTMGPGVLAPPPADILTRLKAVYGNEGLTPTNSAIDPSGASFDVRSDGSFTFTIIISDTPGFTSDKVAATITADLSTTLNNTLGVATVALGPPASPPSNAGQTAAIVIVVLLLLAIIAGLVYVKIKKPALWKSWGESISHCFSSCKPAKGTNI